ncbi:MAG TPA: hypothetical protein VKA46_02715 [Gemmataceae bacterium]|nr:hypothetical protein [Gemmataceae bacterium]
MKWVCSLVAGSLLAVALCGPARAAEGDKKEGLRELAGALAQSARKVAEKNKQTRIRVGYFTPSGIDQGNAGGAFMAELALALGTFANPAAPFELKGEFFFVADPNNAELKVIKVKARLTDIGTAEDVAEFKEFVGFIRSVGDIAKITGATVPFKPDNEYDGPPSDGRNKDLQKRLPPGPGKPPAVEAHIDGTFVSTRKDSPYAVEISTKPLNGAGAAVPRKATLENGLAFVPIDKGELYEVRVVNNSDHEIAVSLSIDGIDQFTFSEDRKEEGTPRFSHWIVAPRKDVIIYGWHKTASKKRKDNVLSFLVTEYGKGAASKFPTQSQGKVGTITVGIARSHPPGTKGGSETGFGPPVEVKQEVVRRDIDAPHEFITVRYAR